MKLMHRMVAMYVDVHSHSEAMPDMPAFVTDFPLANRTQRPCK